MSIIEAEKYFKQLNVYQNIKCQYDLISDTQIETVPVTLKIISCKVIDTIEGTSLEGQYLTGKKLVIVGNLCAKIFIRTREYCKTCYWWEQAMPFSTFIIVPKDICEDEPRRIKHTIQDVTTRVITPGMLFISVTLLLEYQDEY